MWNKWALLGLVLLILSGCGTKRKVTASKDNSSAKETPSVDRSNVELRNLDFRTFSGKAKTDLAFGNRQHDVTLNFRIERDKKIWISITAILGVEVARVLITPDSVKVINKIHSEYISKPFSYIYKYTSPGVTFSTLQDLFLANVSRSLLHTDQLTVATSTDEMQLVGVKDQLSFQYSLNGNRRPKVFRLTSVGDNQNMEAYYGNYATIAGHDFPQNQNIKLSAANIKVTAVLDYSKVEFNQTLEYPFTIPNRYKSVE